MKVFVVANQKGGIGKTTTATTLVSRLTGLGYKTLLIDGDPQRNSTDTFRGKVDGVYTLYDVILREESQRVPITSAIQHTQWGDLVASHPRVKEADNIISKDYAGPYLLKLALSDLAGYDYVVIDTHPDLNAILHSALVAADEVIIPLTADRYSLQGILDLIDSIHKIKKTQNPGLSIAGFLFVMHNSHLNISAEAEDAVAGIAERCGTKVFDAKIRNTVRVRESQGAREPLPSYAPSCTAMKDYEAFVDELIRGDK